jgi:ABC-type oligopeptide transport system ATPase subunit
MSAKFPLPKKDSRTIIVGKTGCGKTTLATKLLNLYGRVFVLDSKAELRLKNYIVFNTLDKVQSAKYNRIIYSPNASELLNKETIDDFFAYVYNQRDCCVYIDELLSITQHQFDIGYHLKAILTRGRSRNIACIMSTQSPMRLPHYVLSQAEYYYVFQLRLPQDRKRIYEITGLSEEKQQSLRKYEFLCATEFEIYDTKFRLKI